MWPAAHNPRRGHRRPVRKPWYIHLCKCLAWVASRPFVYAWEKSDPAGKRWRRKHYRWPTPAPTQPPSQSLRQNNAKASQTKGKQKECKLFTLPLEIRMAIYDFVFDFGDIHMASMLYRGKFSEYRLEAYPCFAEPESEHNALCGSNLIQRRPCTCPRRRGNPVAGARQLNDPACLPHSTDKRGRKYVGLWDVMNVMFASRLFRDDMYTMLQSHRTYQFLDLTSLITFGVAMPRTYFSCIRSVYLNAKYSPRRTSFLAPISHFPRTYRRQFAHLPPASSATPSTANVEATSSNGPGRQAFLASALHHPPSAWQAACHTLSEMASLQILEMQLCRVNFPTVSFVGQPDASLSSESTIFAPLEELARKKGDGLAVFEVEVDWEGLEDGKGKGFEVVRSAPYSWPWS